jgi:hypothetical protein
MRASAITKAEGPIAVGPSLVVSFGTIVGSKEIEVLHDTRIKTDSED